MHMHSLGIFEQTEQRDAHGQLGIGVLEYTTITILYTGIYMYAKFRFTTWQNSCTHGVVKPIGR